MAYMQFLFSVLAMEATYTTPWPYLERFRLQFIVPFPCLVVQLSVEATLVANSFDIGDHTNGFAVTIVARTVES